MKLNLKKFLFSLGLFLGGIYNSLDDKDKQLFRKEMYDMLIGFKMIDRINRKEVS